jgi:hypothetical protein
MTFRVFALIASISVLAGCGGGGSHAVPSPASSSSGSGTTGAQGTARFTLTIPNSGVQTAAKGRKPQYVSSSTLSAAITANPGNVTTNLDLGVASPLCTAVSGGRACTLPVTAPIGNDTFSMVLCNTAPPCIGGATALSAASNFTSAVTEGAANVTRPLILGGIPLAVDVAVNGTLVAGTPATVPVVVTAYDASNNVIVGAANYADATGAAAPLTVSLGSPQLMLHDGAQTASSITVAGPTDTVTLQLQAPANILGTYVTVKNNASQTLQAFNLTRFVALSGSLTSTPLGSSIIFFPDDIYLAPADNTLVSGVPNGFAFSFTSASGGGYLGYFNAATEGLLYCAVPGGFTLGIGSITSGIASAFNGADNIGTLPTGIIFYPLGQLTNTGPACAGGTPYTSNTTGFAKSLAFDTIHSQLFEGDSDGDLDVNTFTSPTLGGNSVIGTFGGSPPHDLISVAGTTYYLTGTTSSTIRGLNPILTATASGDQLTALRNGQDGRVYALGKANSQVWVYNGTATMQPYTAANAFSITLSTQPDNLAIGPDGNAYATDGGSQIQAVTPGGVQTTLVVPPPGGNVGSFKGIFDGRNGYLYAEYDDGLHAGQEYFYRISH